MGSTTVIETAPITNRKVTSPHRKVPANSMNSTAQVRLQWTIWGLLVYNRGDWMLNTYL
ncbi:MAG: hypothetical protein MUF23_04955 [Pirellula sp.]|nr:hypothetical protein [Pirellula sp.]